MNSTPDRAKDCLPPKKRESRQTSSEQRPPDHFKPPAPLRNRPVQGRMAEVKGPVKAPTSNSHYSKDLLLPPSHLPKFGFPWPPHSPPTMQYSLSANQTGDRCGSKLPVWSDQCSRSMDHGDPALHSHRWQRTEVPAMLQRPISSYRTRGPLDSRDLWPHHFSRPAPFPDHHLDGRRTYTVRKINGLEAADSRLASRSSTGSACIGYTYDAKVKQDSSQTTRKRRYQEDQRALDRESMKDGRAPEGSSAHSSAQDRDSSVTLKASASVSDRSSFSALSPSTSSLDCFSMADAPGEAHIFYSLGPIHHSLPPLAHPLQSPVGPGPIVPLYGLQTEEPHVLKNSQLSPLVENRPLEVFPPGQYNSHGPDLGHSSKGAQGLSRHQASSGTHGLPPAPQPSTFLPHFTKGSLIELSGGHLRRVEDLQTEDFLLCANTSPEFHLSFCTILSISPSSTPGFSNLQVLLADRNTQELLKVLVEYPFFVRDRGWSSCCPQRTAQLYGLHCRQLSEGDVCLALTPVPSAPPTAPPSAPPLPLAIQANAPATGTTALAAQRTPTDSGAEGGTRRPPNLPPPRSPAPPPKPNEPPRELASARKRRWSAPGLLAVDGPQDSPHVFGHREQK
ncbi:uncharacterized protein LOC108936893 [Scleropages formosus]|uniref:Uncharacterized LOC108936893 n=1 Tax=Scleropages formosus TaxID=113540 RepID=A0A8C9V8E0_SCLFO|nr:uncharacterized protein LOC108936893 [Scleropages formosus]XP_018612052.2 uncharacterized protein LOC108936893 [Scleropages formosus]